MMKWCSLMRGSMIAMGCKYLLSELLELLKIKHGDDGHEISKYDNISYSTTKVDRYGFLFLEKSLHANIVEVVAGTTGYQA